MLNTTVGQLLVNETLPESLRDYNRTLDKKGTQALLRQVAREYPEKYRDISFKLSQLGQRAAQDQGGLSFGLRHLKRSRAANEVRDRINYRLSEVLSDDSLTDKQRSEFVVRTVGRESEAQQKAVYDEAVKDKNPLGLQILSGSRGNALNLASLLASDMLYTDHRGEVIPIPVLRSYAEGLSPAEYWAGTYGARRGIISTKFATQDAGYLSKQLNQASHRLVVTGEDEEVDPTAPTRGLIVDTDDMDNEGALLAQDAGPYPRNTLLTPKILKQLFQSGKRRILVRSPLVGGSADGGVYARDVGVRETGKLPGRGEQVGLQAAQALSEPISQGQLDAKHSGGVAGQEKAVGGFKYLDQLIQIPQKMAGGAAHATLDGTVQRVEEAAAGGQHVTIDGKSHYVGAGFIVRVKKGDVVEAGDMISDGIPNPSIITEHKGVGEGRRYFVNEFRTAMRNSNMGHHRRNIELLARGLINHVKLTEETDTNVPDDIVPYSTLEHTYKPRAGYEQLTPKKALGQYLERPVLHYTIGTKVRPSMLRDFEEFGVTELPVHKQAPPFVPHMVRGMYNLQHDPDWLTQMYGAGLKKSLLTSTARGATSEERGTSFVPSLAFGIGFGEGEDRAVIKPKAPYALPSDIMPNNLMKAADNTLLSNILSSGVLGSGLGATAGLGYAALTDKKYKQRALQGGFAGGLLGGGLGYALTGAAQPVSSNLMPSPLQAPGRPRLTPRSDRATLEVRLDAIGQPQQLAPDLPQNLSPPDANEVKRRRHWEEDTPEPTWSQYLFEGKRKQKDDVPERSFAESLFNRAQGRRRWEEGATEPSPAERVARGKTNFELESPQSKERLAQVRNDLDRTTAEYNQSEKWRQENPNATASELQAQESHAATLQARYTALREQGKQLEVDSHELESRNQGVFVDGLALGGLGVEKIPQKLLQVPKLGPALKGLKWLSGATGGGIGGPIGFALNAAADVPKLVDEIRTNGWKAISDRDAKQHMHDLTLQNGIMPALMRILDPVLSPVPTASMVVNQIGQGGEAVGSLISGGTNPVEESAKANAKGMNLIHETNLANDRPELKAWEQRLAANPQDQEAARAVKELRADVSATEQEVALQRDPTKDWKYQRPEFKEKLQQEVSLAASALKGARERQESPETIQNLENWHSQVERLAASQAELFRDPRAYGTAPPSDFPRLLQLAVRGPQQRQIEIQRELARGPPTEQAVALRREYTNNVVKLQKMHNWAK